MRFWFSGPRLFHGLVRPGISLGPEDFISPSSIFVINRPPKLSVDPSNSTMRKTSRRHRRSRASRIKNSRNVIGHDLRAASDNRNMKLHWHRTKVRQTQRPSRRINQIVMGIRRIINNIAPSPTCGPALKATQLRNHFRMIEKRYATRVQHRQKININCRLGLFTDVVRNPLVTKQLADKLTRISITGDFIQTIGAKHASELGNNILRRKRRPELPDNIKYRNVALASAMLSVNESWEPPLGSQKP
jgi:hypothetical protein